MKKLARVGVFLTLGLFVFESFFISSAQAQEGCGEIYYGEENASPITNCLNPFEKTHDETSFSVEGVQVTDGASIVVGEDGTDSYGFVDENYFSASNFDIYRHEGSNYHKVDTDFAYPTEEAITAKISEYFAGDEIYTARYKEIYFAQDKYDYFYINDEPYFDAQLDRYVEEVYQEMEYFVESTVHSPRAVLLPGTYTLTRVDTDEGPGVSQRNILDWLLPKAYAYYNVYTVTFTLLAEPPAPSVLFFPGIMGSRLFEESAVCNLFGGVDEVERWVSTFDCDTERLIMDENGQSVYPLFTKVEGGIVEDVGVVSNLYDSFFTDLAEWEEDGIIADYRGVPYDWRLRLDDILKTVNVGGRISLDPSAHYQDGYVYKSLAAMVSASPSEKVVLVGHSNGGLVIKTLLATMKAENDPLLDSIEKVVLVAVPQAGTPESVVGMLHGVEIGLFGIAISEEQSRELINTGPFGYHLLPSEEYFDMIDTPVITIEEGTSTNAWREQFGAEMDSLTELTTFLSRESGRTTPEWSDTLTPATAHSHLIDYANSAHTFMQDWKPSETLVYEVAGTGINTPTTIDYFTDTECVAYGLTSDAYIRCVEFAPKLGYRVSEVIDGDGTVVTPSALALPIIGGNERWYVDLERYNRTNIDRKHKNIFEVQNVQDLIYDIVSSNTIGGYDFISTTEPSFEGKSRLVYQLHSPLDLYVILHDGEVVSSSTPFVRGVEYRRYGEVQQLSISEEETDYEIRLSGLATGSFTLDIDSYEGNTLADRQTYSAVPSGASTEVSLRVAEDEDAVLEIDYQGDGTFEATVLPGLALIVPTTVSTTPEVTETKSKSSGTRVKVRSLPSAPVGGLSGGEVVTSTQQELMLQLITLLVQYRDLLLKLKVQ